MDREEHFRKLERMYATAPVNRFFRPVLRVSDGEAEVTIPVREDFFHAAGAIHGSVYFKALDDAAFFAVNSLVTDVFVLTVGFHVDLLAPVIEGTLSARGTVVHRSRNLFVAEAVLLDGTGRQVARGGGTFLRGRTALSEDIGYR